MSARGLGLILLAAPFMAFSFVLFANPPTAGYFAGTALSSLIDPVIAIGVVVAGLSAAFRAKWYAGLAIGVIVAAVHIALGYSWWLKVAGYDAALRQSLWVAAFDPLVILYGFLGIWVIAQFSANRR
jgi:hypothetical protein